MTALPISRRQTSTADLFKKLPPLGTVTVKKGDTLSSIAKRCKCTVADLVKANPKLRKDANHLEVGQRLRVPFKGSYDPTKICRPPKERTIEGRAGAELDGRASAGASAGAGLEGRTPRMVDLVGTGAPVKVPWLF